MQQIEKLKDPARFAQEFLEDEIKARYLNKPYEIGDFVFTVSQQDFRKSLFSPDANLAIALEYPSTGMKVAASGLYFRYRKRQLPEPVFDKLRIDRSSLDGLVKNMALKALGDAIPSFSLPVEVKVEEVPDFRPENGDRRGRLRLFVSVDCGQLLDFASDNMPAIKGHVNIHATKKLAVEVEDLTGTVQLAVPLGNGLFIQKGSITLRPKNREKPVMIRRRSGRGRTRRGAMPCRWTWGSPLVSRLPKASATTASCRRRGGNSSSAPWTASSPARSSRSTWSRTRTPRRSAPTRSSARVS